MITSEAANYRGDMSYSNGPRGRNRQTTTSLNYFNVANRFGLCDMHGNVWEWCKDYWHSNYKKAPTNISAWLSEGESSSRVVRGGSWINGPKECRSAFRMHRQVDARQDSLGFRIVCHP